MTPFIFQQNIERYRRQLKAEADENRRRMLLQLLAEEEAKLAEFVAGQAPRDR